MSMVTARDLMIPLDEIPHVKAQSSLSEAVDIMEGVSCPFGIRCSRHHHLMVTGPEGKVEGWLGVTDVLLSLDPRYHSRKGLESINAPGVNPDQIREFVESFGSSQNPLDGICDKAARVRIRDLMHRPTVDERIDAGATIDEVVTSIVNGGHSIVLVTDGEDVLGVLRLDDLFEAVAEAIRRCEI